AHLIVEEWVPELTHQSAAPQFTIHNSPSTLPEHSSLAIIGIEATVGPYPTFADFAQALLDGRGGTTLDTVDVDLSGLRFPPNDLKHTLPQQLLILEVARRLAASHPKLPTERTSVYIGMGCDPEIARYSMRWRLDEWASQWAAVGQPVTSDWVAAAKVALIPGLEAAGVIGTMPNIPANRINAQLNLLGPSHTVSAEELSGLRALECAADALRRGEIDAAFVGAVDLSVEAVHQAAAAHLLDAQRQMPGDAAVVLLLKRVEDARLDGDEILAMVETETARPSPPTSRPASEMYLGLADNCLSLTKTFGHAHAASGLLDVAVGTLCVRDRVRLSIDADGLLQPAEPWLAAAPRTVRVQVDALGGQSSAVLLHAGDAQETAANRKEKPGFFKKPGFWNGAIHVFSGADAAAIIEALGRNEESSAGPARLVIVVQGDATFESQRQIASRALTRVMAASRPSSLTVASGSEPPASRPTLLGKGIYWSPAPMPGEVGFVFTPAAAAYQGMGRELLFALPDLGDQVVGKFPCLERTQDWLATALQPSATDPFQVLQGCALLSQLHATLTQDWLGIKPAAVLGVSSGETNSMFATGAWHDMDAMFAEIDASGMYTCEIAGEYQAARRAWQDRDAGPITWAGWRVLAPVAEVEAALADEEFAHLTMINAPADCLVAGQAAACRRVVEKIGLHRCVENANEIIAHHPAIRSWEAEWRAIHHRETQTMEGVRFYANARGGAYTPDRESVADALTDQATARVDFRRVVEAAWQDGVRIFVEHGPRNVCSGWIRSILGDREHLVVALDRPQHGVEQLFDAVAQLVAAGVAVEYQALVDVLSSPAEPVTAPRRVLSIPAHYPPVVLPPVTQPAVAPSTAIPTPFSASRDMNAMISDYQLMEPPPPLPPVLDMPTNGRTRAGQPTIAPIAAPPPSAASRVQTSPMAAPASQPRNLSDSGVVSGPASALPPEPTPARNQMVDQLMTFHATISAAHQRFLAQQERAMALLVALHNTAGSPPVAPAVPQAAALAPVEVVHAPPIAPPPPPIQVTPTTQAAPPSMVPVAPQPAAPVTRTAPVVTPSPSVKSATPRETAPLAAGG
ncbi:MAG: beta-ketoacyl synthase N-terminal-like domain-containing protein, partial [Caldilinea sp.]